MPEPLQNVLGEAQSASLAHAVLHVVASAHAKPPAQATVVRFAHVPAPSQVPVLVT
jgi:hypothetical protein